MNGQYKSGDMVLGNWILKDLLGEGSFGKVFRAEREDFGTIYTAAVKIITIPQSTAEIKSARAEGMDEESVVAYFRSFVEEIVREFALMSRLKGTANIVSYEDHTVLQHKNNLGWDIIIRMELLTPLLDYCTGHQLTRQDVTKLGIDICRALELCQKFNVVHRDIKPENIFVSELGDYKLGDFGIARTVEKTTSGLSKKGTYTYMAPEIYRGDAYGSCVDIYSLGIVLYRMLNDNRAPFLPEYPVPITHSARETALAKRISGAALPKPKNADGRLAEIVLKACAYNPKDRYSSPMLMREELEAIQYSKDEAPMIYPLGDETPQKSLEYMMESAPVIATPTPRVIAVSTPPVIAGSDPQSPDKPVYDGTVGMFGGRKCTSCGFDIDNNAVFCNKCGVKQGFTGRAEDHEKTESMFSTPVAPIVAPPVPQSPEPFPIQRTEPKPSPVNTYIPPYTPPPHIKQSMQKPAKSNTGKVVGGVIAACLVLVVILFIIIPTGGESSPPAAPAASPAAPVVSPPAVASTPTPSPTPTPEPKLSAVAVGWNEYGQSDLSGWSDIVAISGGGGFTIGLKSDGTVISVGQSDNGRRDVSGWSGIVAISAGLRHTVGIKSNGTVVAVGENEHGQCNISGWRDIIAVAAGNEHTVGLKSDGTVVAVGGILYGELNVTDWNDIIEISAGNGHTVGLKSDGTVVAVGYNEDGRCDVSGWTNIVAIAAGQMHTIGLKSDGTVVAVGNNPYGECDVSGWRNIIAITAGMAHTVGLKSDGTVVATGHNVYGETNVTGWRNIVSISAGTVHTIGLTTDENPQFANPANPPGPVDDPVQGNDQIDIVGIWRTEWREAGSNIYMDISFSEFGDFFLQMGHDRVVQIEVEGVYVIEDNKIHFRGYDNIYSEYVYYIFTYGFSGNTLIFGWEGDIQREFTRR